MQPNFEFSFSQLCGPLEAHRDITDSNVMGSEIQYLQRAFALGSCCYWHRTVDSAAICLSKCIDGETEAERGCLGPTGPLGNKPTRLKPVEEERERAQCGG